MRTEASAQRKIERIRTHREKSVALHAGRFVTIRGRDVPIHVRREEQISMIPPYARMIDGCMEIVG